MKKQKFELNITRKLLGVFVIVLQRVSRSFGKCNFERTISDCLKGCIYFFLISLYMKIKTEKKRSEKVRKREKG